MSSKVSYGVLQKGETYPTYNEGSITVIDFKGPPERPARCLLRYQENEVYEVCRTMSGRAKSDEFGEVSLQDVNFFV